MTDLSPLAVPDTLELLRPVLPPAPATICEVGCGRGALAAALDEAGYHVTGLEPNAESAALARDRGVTVVGDELLAHRPGHRYDVVLFTRSLHHLDDLDAAVGHALELLVPGGPLIAEEFARERADRAAAAFLFDTLAVLAAAGAAELPAPGHGSSGHGSAGHGSSGHGGGAASGHGHGVGRAGGAESGMSGHAVVGGSGVPDPAEDPLVRWASHFGDHAVPDGTPPPPMHDTDDIVEALRRKGLTVQDSTMPTLWRMVANGLRDVPEAAAIARCARAVEYRRVADGSLPALGRLLVART